MRRPRTRWQQVTFGGLGVALFGWFLVAGSGWAVSQSPPLFAGDPRVVRPDAALDADGNRAADTLETAWAQGIVRAAAAEDTPAPGLYADLTAALARPPLDDDRARIAAAGGQVIAESGREETDLVFALRVAWPVTAGLEALFAALPAAVWVDETPTPVKVMSFSTRQTRARYGWTNYGVRGDPSHTVVVMDTGLDDTHPDLGFNPATGTNPRIVGWRDVTPNNSLSPRDLDGHGTHVAGSAIGGGNAAGLTAGTGQIPISDTTNFTGNMGTTFLSFFPVDTTGFGAPAAVELRLRWENTGAAGDVTLHLLQFTGGGYTSVASVTAAMSAAQPLLLNATIPAGQMRADWAAGATRSVSGDTSKYWVQVRAPFSAVSDGERIMNGMAPGPQIAGVRIFEDSGQGSGDVVAGLNWVSANRAALNIVVLNNSWQIDSVDVTVDTAVNNLVGAGVVVASAMGNSRDTGVTAKSPATASKGIGVAATSDTDAIAWYSSAGASGAAKPDVAAPGGSSVALAGEGVGRFIGSVDTNDSDEDDTTPQTADRYPNDYTYAFWQGTSMASPHVAGAAALLVDGFGAAGMPWDWTQDKALRVKMLLGMTATETNQNAEAAPHPTLDRGAKDISEGFGRINVDAALDALLRQYLPGDTTTGTLGGGAFDAHAWARKMNLKSGVSYGFSLTVPGAADYDLYLYRDAYTNDGSTSNGSIGDPIIELKSTTAGLGGTEVINFTPGSNAVFYLVVKRVSGGGAFTLTSTTGGPVVAITGPAESAMLSCCLQVTATASPGVSGQAITEVRFSVNGILQFTDTTAPYEWDFNTIAAGCVFEGVREIGATAVDAAGAETSDAVTVTIRNGGFSDVPCDYWAFVFIARVVCEGIAAGFGDGTYRPTQLVSRGQMAVFMARAADLILGDFTAFVPPACGSETFTDVDCNHFAYKFVEYIVTKGIASGFGDGTYRPNNNVSRGAMAIFLSRVRDLLDSDFAGFSPPGCGSETFPDVDCNSPFFVFVEYIVSKGITAGFGDGTYRPSVLVSRDQMAVFVTRTVADVMACPPP